MKMSTRGRYGLRAIVELAALSQDGCCVSLKTIAALQEIPEGYLEQLIKSLKKSGLVKGIRGARGGYVLSRPPDEITVGEVLRSLEGDLSPVNCVTSDEQNGCGGTCDRCATKSVWAKMFKSVNDVVDSISISELAEERLAVMAEDDTI